MIPATKIVAEYRKHLNRINSGFGKSLSITQTDSYINEAYDYVFESLNTFS